MKYFYIIVVSIILAVAAIDFADSCKRLDEVIIKSLQRGTELTTTVHHQNSKEKSSKVYLKSLFK